MALIKLISPDEGWYISAQECASLGISPKVYELCLPNVPKDRKELLLYQQFFVPEGHFRLIFSDHQLDFKIHKPDLDKNNYLHLDFGNIYTFKRTYPKYLDRYPMRINDKSLETEDIIEYLIFLNYLGLKTSLIQGIIDFYNIWIDKINWDKINPVSKDEFFGIDLVYSLETYQDIPEEVIFKIYKFREGWLYYILDHFHDWFKKLSLVTLEIKDEWWWRYHSQDKISNYLKRYETKLLGGSSPPNHDNPINLKYFSFNSDYLNILIKANKIKLAKVLIPDPKMRIDIRIDIPIELFEVISKYRIWDAYSYVFHHNSSDKKEILEKYNSGISFNFIEK